MFSDASQNTTRKTSSTAKERVKLCFTLLGMLIVAVTVGTLLLILAYCIPTKRISNNVATSIITFNEEGLYPFVKPRYVSTVLDNWTDTLIYTEAMYRSGDALQDAMLNPNTQYGNSDPLTNLNLVLKNQNTDENKDVANYPRYWHGYLIFVKPLLTICNLHQIRIINTTFQIVLICLLMLLLYKKLNFLYACAFFGVIMMINPLVTGKSLQFSSIQYAVLLSCLMLLVEKDKLFEKYRDIRIFCLTGIFVGYFDLLTYPLASLGVPLLLCLAIYSNCLENKNLSESKKLIICIKTIIADAASWTISYVLMWSSKWFLTTWLTDTDAIQDALNQANFKLSGEVTASSGTQLVKAALGTAALNRNFILVLETNTLPALAVFAILALLLLVLKKYKFSIKPHILLCDIVISAWPLIWYMILKNHSYIHFWMTYRNLTLMTYAAFMIIASSFKSRYSISKS